MLYVVVCVKAVCIVVVVERDYNEPQALGSSIVRILSCYLHS
jgi:hypothetical protein